LKRFNEKKLKIEGLLQHITIKTLIDEVHNFTLYALPDRTFLINLTSNEEPYFCKREEYGHTKSSLILKIGKTNLLKALKH
jgi:hypothetical protein